MPDNRSTWLRRISLASFSAWLLVTILLIFAPTPFLIAIQWYLISATLTVFSLAHALRRYDGGKVLAAFASAAIIATAFEQCSISTGVPFGYYVHTPALGVKIFSVPIIIGPIFFSLCYLGWNVAQAAIGPVARRTIEFRIAVPIVSACLVTACNMCSDPIGATIGRSWLYREQGAYFGVPLSNYMGWLITTWVIVQVFELILNHPKHEAESSPRFWYEPCLVWALMGLQYPIVFLLTREHAIAHDSGNWPWSTEGILGNAALVGLCGMAMTAALAMLAVRARTLRAEQGSGTADA